MAQSIATQIAAQEAIIAKATEKLATLKVQFEQAEALENVEKGSVIVFDYGRGEARAEFSGAVLAIKATEKLGNVYKVLIERDGNPELASVPAGQVKRVVVEEANEGEAGE